MPVDRLNKLTRLNVRLRPLRMSGRHVRIAISADVLSGVGGHSLAA